jgi:acetyl esterase/lipase
MADQKSTSSSLAFEPEFAEYLKIMPDMFKMPPPTNIHEFRKMNDPILKVVWKQLPPPPATQETVFQVPTLDGITTIPVTRFVGEGAGATTTTPKPAWLYLHGGGMATGSVDVYASQMARLAALSGVAVFGVEYRLAPEHPAPIPVDDCYAALTWVSAHAEELRLDVARLGVMGDSAGGGLAAGVARK